MNDSGRMNDSDRRPAAQWRFGLSYTRFSSAWQHKGDSQDRQDAAFPAFCRRHDLIPLKDIYADRGRSGYTDDHRKRGYLGQLIARAKAGGLEPGTVVVVEAWDRLGRLRPDRQIDLLRELLCTGVAIGVDRLNNIFCEEDFGSEKWVGLALFVQLAYQESKQKGERLAASWQRRREKARLGLAQGARLLAGKPPAWVEVAGDGLRLVTDRTLTVKRIFALAAAGLGQARIVAALEKDGLESFGGRCGRWTRRYIASILNDRRAVGEVQPRRLGRVPDGAPIAGALPAAVSEQEYALARAGQLARHKSQRRTEKQGAPVNAFKGLLRHARDGMGFVLMGKGHRGGPSLLVSRAGNEGHAPGWTFPYDDFEAAVLSLLREVRPADVTGRADEAPSRAEALRAGIGRLKCEIGKVKASLKRGHSEGLVEVLREHEAALAADAQALHEELARTARPAGRALEEAHGLIDLLRAAPDPGEARLRLRAALRQVIEAVDVLIVRRGSRGHTRYLFLQVRFVGGRRRDYLIYHRTAGCGRRGGWEARSLAGPGGPGAVDLRDLAAVARLDAWLAARLAATPPPQ